MKGHDSNKLSWPRKRPLFLKKMLAT